MTNMKNTIFAALAICAVLCSCCSHKEASNFSPADILGKWIITQAGDMPTAQAEQVPHINFTDSGTVHGCAAVNSFMGYYTTNGDTIAFTQIGITTMLGTDKDMLIESAIMQAINTGKNIEMKDSTLLVKDADNNTLMALERE